MFSQLYRRCMASWSTGCKRWRTWRAPLKILCVVRWALRRKLRQKNVSFELSEALSFKPWILGSRMKRQSNNAFKFKSARMYIHFKPIFSNVLLWIGSFNNPSSLPVILTRTPPSKCRFQRSRPLISSASYLRSITISQYLRNIYF